MSGLEENEEANVELHDDLDDIKETDIVFECPECGKSIVIDYRGAGLSVPCPDCEALLEVPIPEGMDISELDREGFDVDAMDVAIVEELNDELAEANEKINELVTEVEELKVRRRYFEKRQKEMVIASRQLNQHLSNMKNVLVQMQESISKLAEKSPEDTQDLG